MFAIRNGLVLALLVAVAAAPALAIELGDPAPALKVKEWIKGKPVDLKAGKGKNIYVVEFWATWCKPCRISIPHLTEMQKKLKDKGVVFIGISSRDRDLETVKKFVKDQGSKMDYTVAYEEIGAAETDKAYLEAFKIRAIPHAFVVDKQGRLAWHGHPMVGLDRVLDKLVGGRFDLEAEKRLARNRAKGRVLLGRYFETVITSKNAEEADKLAKEFMPLIEQDDGLLNTLSWEILTNEGVQHRDLDLALRAAKTALALTEGQDANIVDTYARALWDTGKKEQAIKYQEKAVKLAGDGPLKAPLEKTLKGYQEKMGGDK